MEFAIKVKAHQLRPNQLCWVAGMLMYFDHWCGETPVFRHAAKGPQINFVNRSYTRETLITVAKPSL